MAVELELVYLCAHGMEVTPLDNRRCCP